MQGFFREYGEAGVGRFFDTTDGWDAPVLDDRRDPVYPRHQRLHDDERALSDMHLQRLAVEIITARP